MLVGMMNDRKLPPRFLFTLLVASMLSVLAASVGTRTQTTEAAGAVLNFPSANCAAGSTATVTFSWTPVADATQIWLDITTQDNGWAGGTFINNGFALAGGATSFNWSGIWTNVP